MTQTTKINVIIHSFALAHALTAACFNFFGLRDDIPLTVLTIAMIIIIARAYDFPLDVASVLALLSCFAGFYLGIKGAEIMSQLLGGYIVEGTTDYIITPDDKINTLSGKLIPFANVITTAIVTEFLGWMMFLIVRRNKKSESDE